MNTRCPCCQQILPPEDKSVRLYVPNGIVVRADNFVQLSQAQMTIANTVFEKRPQLVPMETLVEALYGHLPDGGPEDAVGIVRTQVFHTNRRLKKLKLIVCAVRNLGYQLVELPL